MRKTVAVQNLKLGESFSGMPRDILFLIATMLSGRDIQAMVCTAKGFKVLNDYQLWNNKLKKEFLISEPQRMPKRFYSDLYEASFNRVTSLIAPGAELNEVIINALKTDSDNTEISFDALKKLYLDALPRAADGELSWLQEKMQNHPELSAVIYEMNRKQISQRHFSPLLLAVANGHTDVAEWLLADIDFNLDQDTKQNFRALIIRVIHFILNSPREPNRPHRDFSTVRALMDNAAEIEDYQWNQILMHCCDVDNVEGIEDLLQLTKDKESFAQKAIMHACKLNFTQSERRRLELRNEQVATDCLNFILATACPQQLPSVRVEINARSKTTSLLNGLVVEGKTEALNTLLEKFPRSEETPQKNFNTMQAAVHFNQLACLLVLHQHGLDVSHTQPHGDTLLHYAAKLGHVEIVSWLLTQGLDPEKVDDFANTPRRFALKSVKPEVFRVIEQHLGDRLPLDAAAFPSYFIEQALPFYSAEHDADQEKTLLQFACEFGTDEDVEDVIAAGADVNRAKDERSPLFLYCLSGKKAMVKKLVEENGAKVIPSGHLFGVGPLHQNQPLVAACQAGSADVAAWLFVEGLTVAVPDKLITAMLSALVRSNHSEGLKSFLPRLPQIAHAHLPTTLEHHNAALRLACETGQTAIVRYLLTTGSEIEQQPRSPLFIACQAGQLEVTKLLIDQGANLQFTCQRDGYLSENRTILHAAVSSRNLDLIEFLLQHGLSQNAGNFFHELPINTKINPGLAESDHASLAQIQAVFDRYSEQHVVEFREKLKQSEMPNRLLTSLSQLNGGSDLAPLYTLASNLINEDQIAAMLPCLLQMSDFILEQQAPHPCLLDLVRNILNLCARAEPDLFSQYLSSETVIRQLYSANLLHNILSYHTPAAIRESILKPHEGLLADLSLCATNDDLFKFLIKMGFDFSECREKPKTEWLTDSTVFFDYYSRICHHFQHDYPSHNLSFQDTLQQFLKENSTHRAYSIDQVNALLTLFSKDRLTAEEIKTFIKTLNETVKKDHKAVSYYLLGLLECLISDLKPSTQPCNLQLYHEDNTRPIGCSLFEIAACMNLHHYLTFASEHRIGIPHTHTLIGLIKAAVSNLHREVFTCIIASGQNFPEKTIHELILPGAIYLNNMAILIDYSSRLLDHTRENSLLLHQACINNNTDVVKILIDKGWKTTLKNRNGDLPLKLITSLDTLENVLSWMMNNHRSRQIVFGIEEKNIYDATALKVAIHTKATENIDIAIRNFGKFTAGSIESFGLENPLHIACRHADQKTLKKLLTNMESHTVAAEFLLPLDENGCGALHNAVLSGNPEIVRLCFNTTLNLPLDTKSKDRQTPMQLAFARDHVNLEMIKVLYQAGESIDPAIDLSPHNQVRRMLKNEAYAHAVASLRRAHACFDLKDPVANQHLADHVDHLVNDLPENTAETIALLNEVKTAFINNDGSGLKDAANKFQSAHSGYHLTGSLVFSVISIALAIEAAKGLAIAATVVTGALVVGAVTSAVIAGTFFYQSRHSQHEITDRIHDINEGLQR